MTEIVIYCHSVDTNNNNECFLIGCHLHDFCSIPCVILAVMGSNEVQIQLLLPTFKHEYLYFLLLTFSKRDSLL